VPLLIAHAVKHNPQQKNASGHNRKAVPFKERLVLCVAQREFQTFTSNRDLEL
jgi:hypothetical protein